MPTVRVRDIEIHFEREGQGAPLLFISGTGADLRVRPNVLDGPFPALFDTLAYDQRGLGQSGKPDRPYSMAEYADDAAGLLSATGWEQALVVGVSFGGMVAQELAIRHGQRVRRLVLACTSPGGEGGASFPFHEIEHMTRQERARHIIPISDLRHDAAWAETHREQYEQMLALAAADPFADEPWHEVGRRRQLEARAQHDTWDRLAHIACPTLICAGRYDGIAPPPTQERMQSRIAGSELRFFKGGHLFMLQDKAAMPAMVEFLRASP
jgi:3-oxoadipate enol-lactonase